MEEVYPYGDQTPDVKEVQYPGMTLRDYFAAKAMQGLMANEGADGSSCEQIASIAYLIANHMLAEQDESNEQE